MGNIYAMGRRKFQAKIRGRPTKKGGKIEATPSIMGRCCGLCELHEGREDHLLCHLLGASAATD